MNAERSQAFSDEIDRLLQLDFIRETFYMDARQSNSREEKEQVESLHRLYQSKQSLHQRHFPSFEDRLVDRGNSGTRAI